jgi:hypothetical protein
VQSRQYIDERSWDHEQLLGLQCRLAAQKKLLAQPTTTTNQHTLGFLKTITFVRLRTLFQTYQLPRVGSSMPKNYGDSGLDSTPDSPWMSSAYSSSSGMGMTGSGGGAAIASS